MENELVMTNEDTGLKGKLINRTDSFCSFTAETNEDKARLFKAMNNPEHRVGDCINMNIRVKDIFSEMVTIENKETGEIQNAARIVLIDENGEGYQCVSQGMFSAVKKLISIYGLPTWEEPIEICIKQIKKGGNRNILTFDVVA